MWLSATWIYNHDLRMSDHRLSTNSSNRNYISPRRIQPLKSPLLPNLNKINNSTERTRVSSSTAVGSTNTPNALKLPPPTRLSYSDSRVTKPSTLMRPTSSSLNRSGLTPTPTRNKTASVSATSTLGSPGIKSNKENTSSSLNFNRAFKREGGTKVNSGQREQLVALLEENKKLMLRILQNQEKIDLLMGK